MFGLFDSVEKKMRTNAANWLELANKVFLYRRDELSEPDRQALIQKIEALRGQMRDREDASKLKLGIEALEGVLRKTGGKFYPKSTIQEYVEFFLVAAIVVLGVRTYFVQPFKIPTNSMWPTYYGMTAEVYSNPADAPSMPVQLFRLVSFGAFHKEAVAPVSGQIEVPIVLTVEGGLRVSYQKVVGRKWLIFPANLHRYYFRIGGEIASVDVPEDFDFDWNVFYQAMGLTPEKLISQWRRAPDSEGNPYKWVPMDRQAERGKPFIAFDLLTGDQLFVDRVTYHFFPPKVGQGFVFRTGNIHDIGTDQYYIKRLVGVPGDELQVKEPVLYRNGAPITGAQAFDDNARRVSPYRGYFNADSRSPRAHFLFPGDTLKVPEGKFFAMGDNSANSLDGRYWGFVPKMDVVGRPLWIYFPFTRRWGPAR